MTVLTGLICTLFAAVLPAQVPTDECIGYPDITDNGVVDIDDLLVVLAAFAEEEPCPFSQIDPGGDTDCPADVCACACDCQHHVDLDDILAVVAGITGATDGFCPPRDCPTSVEIVIKRMVNGEWVEVPKGDKLIEGERLQFSVRRTNK